MQPTLKLFDINSQHQTEFTLDTDVSDNVIELDSIESENARLKSELRKALNEKEVLLREVHHRVKNSLQLMISMINLQASGATEKHIKNELKAAQGRIRSLALTHQHLYKSRDLSGINMEDYLYGLSGHILTAEGCEQSEKIRIKIFAPDIYFPLETAVPFGLLVNELISNSIKECSKYQSSGEIKISLCDNQDGSYSVIYNDGAAKQPLTIRNGRVINSENSLIDLLITQLEGSIKDISSDSFTYKINFRGSDYLNRLVYS